MKKNPYVLSILILLAVIVSAYFTYGNNTSLLNFDSGRSITEKNRPNVTKYKIALIGSSPVIKQVFEGFKYKLNEIKRDDLDFEYINLDVQVTPNNMVEIESFIEKSNIDLILTGQLEIPLLAETIKKIPIISILPTDPTTIGLADAETGSGNNVVFFETSTYANAGGRLSYFLELAPNTKKILVLREIENASNNLGMTELLSEAKKRNIIIIDKQLNNRSELNKFILNYDFSAVDAVFRYPGPFIMANIDLFFALESKINKPLIVINSHELESGGVLAYGPRYQDFGRSSAIIAWQILVHKIDPAEIPIQKPFRNELGINEKIANFYGLNISDNLRNKADYIIK